MLGVKGYSIGGKTGTSEDGVNTGKYVTSFVGIADTSDPEVAIVIVLYNPTGEGGHQGGGVAAPIGAQVLGEVLPYLEIAKQTEEKIQVQMPNVTGITVKEAKQILKESNLKIKGEIDENIIITKQVPNAGIEINEGTEIIIE